MSIADLFGSVSPEYSMYAADKAKSEDYNARIKAYEDAYNQYTQDYDKYKTEAEAYNDLVTNYNEKLAAYTKDATAYNDALAIYKDQAQAYNDQLAAYKKQVEDYNAAVNKFNEGDRTIEFKDTDYYVAAPGDFTAVRPDEFTMVRPDEFELTKPEFSLTEPTAPSDPGFDQAEIDAFVKESQGRARRRGMANAAALNVLGQGGNFTAGAGIQGGAGTSTTPEFSFSSTSFEEGGVVPPPSESVVKTAGAPSARGLGYYIPPELRQFGRNAMRFFSAVDPAQGIMRGMAASGRAFDSDLTPAERRAAAIEAGLETIAPVGMIGLGALAKQPAKAVLMDVLTPTGATKDIAEDTLGDPSRRAFLKGAAATAGVAAIAPDLAMEAGEMVTKATKAAAKARINPLDMAMQNIRQLRKQIEEQYEILDSAESANFPVGSQGIVDDASVFIQRTEDEIVDEAYDALIGMDPQDFAAAIRDASDEALEEIASVQYESIVGNQRLVDDGPNTELMAQEMQRRGMHLAKDKNGVSKFPAAETFVMDVTDPITETLDVSQIIEKNAVGSPASLNMTDRTLPADVVQDMEELNIRAMQKTLEDQILKMRDAGVPEEKIEIYRKEKQGDIYEAQGLPRDMEDFYADGGIVGLQEGGAVVAPATNEQLSAMRTKVINDYGFDPMDIALEEGVDPELYLRVMYTENKGRHETKSDAGAIGLMQLMPGTAEELGVNPNSPVDNARGGARYLKRMLDRFESVPLALAAYNAGPGNVAEYGGVPPFEETQNYVAMIAPAITNENLQDVFSVGAENYLMAQPVATPEGIETLARDSSPRPQYRPFDIDYYMGTGSSPRPRLRPSNILTSSVHQQLNPALR